MTTKYLTIVLAGPGGCGKTTTSQTFAAGEPDEYCEERTVQLQRRKDERKVYWTLYDNCALAGNHSSGTDANVGPDVIRQAYEECAKNRRIIIVDGYQSSPRWVEMINAWDGQHPEHEMVVMVVYFHIELEELLRRVAERRGWTLDEIKEMPKKVKRCKGNLRRPIVLMKHFNNEDKNRLETWVLDIYEDDGPQDIVRLLNENVKEILGLDPTEDFQDIVI